LTLGREWISDSPEGLGFDMRRDLICTADAAGHFTSLNTGWEQLLGWTREELMSRPFIEFVHPEDVERTMAESLKLSEPDYELVHFENRYRAKDGTWRWLRWSARSDGETWFAVAFDITSRKEAEHRLREALLGDQLLAYSQPIVEQRGRRIVQEELLVRMRTQENSGRVLAPRDFLPEAERCGLIVEVDRWMVDQGVDLARQGRRAEVNLSAVSIADESLIDDFCKTVEAAGDGSARLVFEITETAALEHLDAAREFAERLTRLGCRIALDDFGTGFGSLTYLRHLPLHYLKIDRAFVSDLPRSPEDRAMVKSIVAIAREFGLRTVAEGVEEEAALGLLSEYGVDYAQGFLLGRPEPIR
jgi:PAS domain S-box-containing protein